MFSKIFGGCAGEPSTARSASKLKQTLEMLEEKEAVLRKKVFIEVERAKEFTKAKNKQAALECLKRKRFYDVQIEQLWDLQLRIHDQEQKLPEMQQKGQCQKQPSKRQDSGFLALQLKSKPS